MVLEKRKHLFGHLVYVGNLWMKESIAACLEKEDANLLLSCEIKFQIERIFSFTSDTFFFDNKLLLLSGRIRYTKAFYEYLKILGRQFSLSQHLYSCDFVDVIF